MARIKVIRIYEIEDIEGETEEQTIDRFFDEDPDTLDSWGVSVDIIS